MGALSWLPRLLGGLTLAYGAAVVARPEVLTRPVGLEGSAAGSRTTRRVIRAVGVRDVLSGAAMWLVPRGRPLRLAVTVRVACDIGDVVGLGVACPGRRNKAKAIGAAATWALLCGSSWRVAGGGR
ncbi:MAG: hypothetical protein ACRDOJ_04600 [Nocardioidaceae bacterium]